jgi:hypothetical protein
MGENNRPKSGTLIVSATDLHFGNKNARILETKHLPKLFNQPLKSQFKIFEQQKFQ